MEFEFWWLLAFPLFFALGWLAARIDIKHLISESRTLPESYFKGLNFLLNEQPDRAIEALSEVVRGDEPETVELHFALGGLFRRRGEVDRAIRTHQSLLERPDLDKEQKLTALFELAQDYHKAGLLDRAEELFGDLLDTAYSRSALEFLLEIYMQEKDWHQAIQTAQRLGRESSLPYHRQMAHFYCELAVGAMVRCDPDAARGHLEKAMEVNRGCVRANILLGDIEAAEKHYSGAAKAWRRIETQDPRYLHLVGERLLTGYRESGRPQEGLELLRGYLARYPSLDLLNVVFQATLEMEGTDAAYRLVRDELRRNPTLQGLDRLLEAQMLDTPVERRHDMQLIKNLVHQHTRRLALYRCDNCGFDARQFHWHCPACGGWETFQPRRREETEMAQMSHD